MYFFRQESEPGLITLQRVKVLMALDFLSPVSGKILDFASRLSSQHLGSKIVFHTKDDFPDLKKIKIAIVGVLENRGDENAVKAVNLDAVRKEFYSLYPGNWNVAIADFGDIIQGDVQTDTYYAVHKVVAFFLKNKIIPVVIGGTQDLTYALYRAFDDLDQMVNLVAIDSKFDFGNAAEALSKDAYLTKIIIETPNNLANFSNIGYQTYYNSQEEIDLIDKLFFDAYRLGDISKDITIAEPIFRNADLVSMDLNAVASANSFNFECFVSNGFNGKEICALSRYAGISDKVSVFGIFNHNNTTAESVLIAQIIWYFIEGFYYRSNEYPFGSIEKFTKYNVPSSDFQLVFYKSNISNRWWIEIPVEYDTDNKAKLNTLLPCSHQDYLSACNQELPERWWKSQRKNMP